jgi:hypothetical protein
VINDWSDEVQRELLAPFERHDWQAVEDSDRRFLPVVSIEDLSARLDVTVGAANWNFEVRPGQSGWWIGRLSVLGVVREGTGKTANDAFIVCANLLGVGRYLACLGDGVVPQGQTIDDVHFSPEDLADALCQAGYREHVTGPVTPPVPPAPKPPKNESAAPTPRPTPPSDAGEDSGRVCSWLECGRPLTRGQANVSLSKFKALLCPDHQKATLNRQRPV